LLVFGRFGCGVAGFRFLRSYVRDSATEAVSGKIKDTGRSQRVPNGQRPGAPSREPLLTIHHEQQKEFDLSIGNKPNASLNAHVIRRTRK
jgi:hypothetical protein